MKITAEMVDYVAALSRLEVSAEQKEKTIDGLNAIIVYMDVLNNVDTDGIEPMSHTFKVKNVFREDEVKPSFDREELLKGAPKRDEEAFIVPKAVE